MVAAEGECDRILQSVEREREREREREVVLRERKREKEKERPFREREGRGRVRKEEFVACFYDFRLTRLCLYELVCICLTRCLFIV